MDGCPTTIIHIASLESYADREGEVLDGVEGGEVAGFVPFAVSFRYKAGEEVPLVVGERHSPLGVE